MTLGNWQVGDTLGHDYSVYRITLDLLSIHSTVAREGLP